MKRLGKQGIFWATCAILLATPAFGDQVPKQERAPADWTPTPARTEPEIQRGPQRQNTSLDPQMILGDLSGGPSQRFLGDILVTDPGYDQVEPAMCKAPDGTLFIAVEQYGVDTDGWVGIYRSTDSGKTWGWWISFTAGDEARNPAITYAERTSTGEKWVHLVVEITSGSNKWVLQIRIDADDPATWDSYYVTSAITGTTDIKPRVCTDNLEYDVYYVYLTYAINAIDYYPVYFSRSTDYGASFSAPVNITGGAENSQFVTRPDIAYGTAGLFVAFEKLGWSGSVWETQVWVTRSTNFGSTWDASVQLTTADDGAWHPSVAAAIDASTVVVAFTQSDGSQTDIFSSYSTNGGDSYSSPSPLPRTFDNEKSVALSVSDSVGRFHAAFWRAYDIEYTYAGVASPWSWAPTTLVNEDNWASSAYSRPAICVNPTKPLTQEACVAWTDYRGAFYDVYFDAGFFDGACCFPDESCVETTETECIDAGGSWQGSGVACDPELCLIDPCDEDMLAPTAELDLGDFQCVPFADSTPIVGTATDPEGNLESWALEERGMGASPWAVVASGSTPISGVMVNWNPAAPGYRMLRLTVVDACGHAATDVRLMYADQGPQATINYPNDGDVIGGSSVCIDGRVSHGVCAIEWLVEYRPSGGGWTYIADGIGSVYNLPLTHWDTTLVPDGLYEIRVSASSIGGVNSQTVGVTVDNTAPIAVITSPANCDNVSGLVPVIGTASDTNLLGWNVAYTGGAANGWVVIDGGNTSVDGLLTNWDTSGLMPCAYTLRLWAGDQAALNCNPAIEHNTYYYVSVIVGDFVADRGDINCDGDVNAYDIDGFIDCVSQGYCDPCPP